MMSYSSCVSADDDDYYDDDGYRYSQPRGGYYREEIIYYPQPKFNIILHHPRSIIITHNRQ